MDTQKIQKTAAIFDRILKIVQGFLLAGVIVAVIFIPLTAILGQKVIADASALELGALKLRLSGDAAEYLDEASIRISIIATLIGAAIALAAGWYCVRVLREALAPMKSGEPFAFGISGKVRKLGWTVLVSGVIADIARTVASVFEMKAYQVEHLLNMDAVSDITYGYSLSLWYVGAALVLFFLSYIFRYGEELQREADETL